MHRPTPMRSSCYPRTSSALCLPERSQKPRSDGLTHVLDKGLSQIGLESLIQTAGDCIDIVKLGWGTAYVSDGVKAKVAICRSAGINLCLGGTLLEICDSQGRITDYVRWLHRLGITRHLPTGDAIEDGLRQAALAGDDHRASARLGLDGHEPQGLALR